MRLIVGGTDTHIGKTVFAAALAAASGAPYWKPVQAGYEPEGDKETAARLGATVLPERYRLKLPASPHQSAAQEGITIDPTALTPPDGPLVIEGVGGLLVPLNRTTLALDVFASWKLPMVLCARTTLGTINHTLLSVEAIKVRNIALTGIAFIGNESAQSEDIIIAVSGAKRLGRLPQITPLNRDTLAAAFAENFDLKDFA